MAKLSSGGGRVSSENDALLMRATYGPQITAPVDLNRATSRTLAAHPLIGTRLANQLTRARQRVRITTPADLYHAGTIDRDKQSLLEACSYGTVPLRALLTQIGIEGKHLYVDEAFTLSFSWLKAATCRPVILSLQVRFPSGRTVTHHVRLTQSELKLGKINVPSFSSGESGELYVLATLRDEAGRVSRLSAWFGVFTRNPVQMYVTPRFHTQSGAVGAPKYEFGDKRWYCHADVRWVNGTSRTVNLGRRVTVRATDAGIGTVADFSFNLSSDIVIPPMSTIYGTLFTSHGSGGIFDEFHAKGDLTFRYTMSGSGFTPTRSMIWRTMRTIGYNIIRIGDFTAAERNEYRRAAIEVASDIFRSRDMTVHGVELYRIEGTREMDADRERYRFIDSDDEHDDVCAKYSVDNWYIDVFFVEGIWDGSFGASYVDAPVDKQGDRSGIVIRRDGDTVNLGQTFAHEAGHHLGLEHADDNDGLADTDPASPQISDNFIFSSSRRYSTVITGGQINKMRQHGLVRSMTP